MRDLKDLPFDAVLTDEESLRDVYRKPGYGAVNKQIDHLDDNCRAFIAHAPFLVMATAGADGSCDVSPKGGPPGFVAVLDEHRLVIPDLSGNNRLDSMRNLVTNAGIGLLFMIPGLDETLRVNGHGWVTTDPDVLALCDARGVWGERGSAASVGPPPARAERRAAADTAAGPPIQEKAPRLRAGFGVQVEEAYIHCAKAFRRSSLWHPDEWPDRSDMPTVACMLRDQIRLDTPAEELEAALEKDYQTTLWRGGGKDPE